MNPRLAAAPAGRDAKLIVQVSQGRSNLLVGEFFPGGWPATAARVTSPRAAESKFELSRHPRPGKQSSCAASLDAQVTLRSRPQTFFAPGRRHARPRDAARSFNSLLRGGRTRFPRPAALLPARARFPPVKEDENTFGSHAGGAAKTTASAFRRRTRSLHGRGPATCGTLPRTGKPHALQL